MKLFFSYKYQKFRVRVNHVGSNTIKQWQKINDFDFCFVSKCLHISNSRTKAAGLDFQYVIIIIVFEQVVYGYFKLITFFCQHSICNAQLKMLIHIYLIGFFCHIELFEFPFLDHQIELVGFATLFGQVSGKYGLHY